MNGVKRILTSVIGLPIVIIALILSNKYVIDVVVAIVAMMALYEYYHAISLKYQPIQWIGYATALSLCFIHLVTMDNLIKIIVLAIPSMVAILFIQLIWKDTKMSVADIALTLFSICYIVLFLMFFSLTYGSENGKFFIWYIIIIAWGTDIFAYLVGKTMGKHKFSKISPNKSLEGCLGGLIEAVILAMLYTYCINKLAGLQISYIYILNVSLLLSIIGQFGDFAASSIKRHVGIKDFSEIIPGHGGILDRMDSLIFIAPFAYMLLILL